MSISGMQGEQLRNNPFFVLNVDCGSDRRTIVAAADELGFLQDSDRCADAQSALLNPQKRLAAELDWFPDADAQLITWIRQAIAAGSRIPIGEFGTITRLNAELYNLSYLDLTQRQQLARFERSLRSIDRLYGELEGKRVAEILNQHRKTAHLAEVSVQEVEQELIQKRYRIRRVLSGCLEKMSDEDCTEKVLKIAQTNIEDNKGKPGVVLLDFVSQYELRMQPKIDALSEKIDAKINFCKMRTGGVLDGALDELMKEVAAWATIVNPMMICGKANGRSHEGTSAMGNKLRNLALYLHNEKEQTAAAAKLTEAMLGIFTYDRIFHNKLTEEVKTLKKLSSQRQNAESLKEEINQVLELATSSEKWGNFEISGKMEELALLVTQLDKKLKELAKEDKELHKIRELIAMAARSVSVVLHNKFNRTQMSVDFMTFLIEIFGDIPAMRSKLRDDKAELDRQLVLAKQLNIPMSREKVPFRDLAMRSSDTWLLDKGKDYQNKKDYNKAFLYYKRAADMGNAEAIDSVGFCYAEGYGVPKNDKEALVWYRRAAEKGSAAAAFHIAQAYNVGQGVPQDKAEGFLWAERSAKLGSKDAAIYVAQCYMSGTNVRRNYESARRYFEIGANSGDANCMCQLAEIYDKGLGVVVSQERALCWYTKAADNKDKNACKFAAQRYEKGEGTPKDPDKAKKYYLLGSELGNSDCTVAAALLFAQKTDTNSHREAVRLCNMAIQQGTQDARIYQVLGKAYMDGQGTEKNYEKAREMFRLAKDENLLVCLEQRIWEDKNRTWRKRKCIIVAAILTLIVGTGWYLYASYSRGMEDLGAGNNQIEATFVETYYYGKAVKSLQRAVSSSSSATSLRVAKDYLSESGNLRDVNSYFSVIDKIECKDYRGALEIIETFPKTRENKLGANHWKEILLRYILELPMDDIQNRMSKLYLNESMYSDEYDEKAFDNELNWGVSEIQTLPERSGEVEIPSLQHIYDTYGKKSAGKILIVKQCMDYPGKKQSTVISFDLMQHLPAKYLPMSIDEVSYVIVVSYGYKDDPTGDYRGSTDALVETGTVTVYSMEDDQKIYSSKVVNGDSPPMFFSYQGSPPAYKSGGKPDIYGEFLKALRKVMK